MSIAKFEMFSVSKTTCFLYLNIFDTNLGTRLIWILIGPLEKFLSVEYFKVPFQNSQTIMSPDVSEPKLQNEIADFAGIINFYCLK